VKFKTVIGSITFQGILVEVRIAVPTLQYRTPRLCNFLVRFGCTAGCYLCHHIFMFQGSFNL